MNHFHCLKYVLAISLLSCGAQYSNGSHNQWKKWSIDSRGNGADGVHTADINRDGFIDVVSGWEQSGDILLYLNPGKDRVTNTAPWPWRERFLGIRARAATSRVLELPRHWLALQHALLF